MQITRLAAPMLTLMLTLMAGAGCASTTSVEHVWRAPGWSGSFTHVAIFGLSKQVGVRRDFETHMAAALAEVGVAATPSFELFPAQDPEQPQLRKEDIARVLSERGIDAALTAQLVGISTQARYVDGHPYAVMSGTPPGFYGYYHGSYAVMYSSGYSVEYDIVTIETNLYATGNSELVWSALSETFAPETINETIQSYAQTMVAALVDTGMLSRTIDTRG